MSRNSKDGNTHYFHKAVACAMVGSDPHIVIGAEMLKPKLDESSKYEGEFIGSKRLLENLHKKFGHFADIVCADALYCKAPWIKLVQSLGMDVVIRVKDERLNIVKMSNMIFKISSPKIEWKVQNKNNKYTLITAWEAYVKMTNLDEKVRYIKFVEEKYEIDQNGEHNLIESSEKSIISTNKKATIETLWKIMHKRWGIENNVFRQLKEEWHFDHCFLHSKKGIQSVLLFEILAFNLIQLFFFRCLRNFRKKKLLQIRIIEDMWDDLIKIKRWKNPIFNST